MKLKTMLLPTGEFIIVIGDAAGTDPQVYRDNLEDFRERTGAVAVFVTDQSVEVEDALYDGGARRRDELPGVWQDLGYLTEDTLTQRAIDEANEFIVDFAKANRVPDEDLPDPFTPGTRVEIIGDALWHDQEEWPGRFGVVKVPSFTPEVPERTMFVRSEEKDESGYINHWFFPPSSLQPVPAILEYDEGDDD
jgi:hypothetical protein